jgi:hypothetical protein
LQCHIHVLVRDFPSPSPSPSPSSLPPDASLQTRTEADGGLDTSDVGVISKVQIGMHPSYKAPVGDPRQQVRLFVCGLKLKADVNIPLHQAKLAASS